MASKRIAQHIWPCVHYRTTCDFDSTCRAVEAAGTAGRVRDQDDDNENGGTCSIDGSIICVRGTLSAK